MTNFCRVKRSYTAATEVYELPETRPNPVVNSGGPVQTYPYEQPERGYIKRQRSDSDYASPHAYPDYARSTMQQYGLPSNTAYGQHPPQPPQNDQQTHMANMMPMQQSMIPGWQQPQASYPTSIGGSMAMSGGSYYGGSTSSAQPPRTQLYTHTSPLYGGRPSNDIYSGMNSLPTPTSEQSLGSTQSSVAGYGQTAPLSALPSQEHQAQHYDLSNRQYHPPPPQNYRQTTQSYHNPASNVLYDQHPTGSVKIESQGYSSNLYSAPPHTTYSTAEGFTSNDLPLSSGMLNREFPGAYQQQPHGQAQGQEPGAYAEIAGGEPDISGYQQAKSHQQSAAYPTPHQTSPAQLQDHG